MKCKIRLAVKGTLLAMAIAGSAVAQASETEQCATVRFTDPGWTDVRASNALATNVLEGLGYKTTVMLLGAPIGFESLKSGRIDVFLGNWMPAQTPLIEKYANKVDVVRANLEGAKFTLAVPQYVYDRGVHSFADLVKYSTEFKQRIYGVDAGAVANLSIQKMIEKNDFGLKKWELVDSSEQGMLTQVQRAVSKKEFIVFLGWEPHQMNLRFDMAYLSGGDEYFGGNYGDAKIYTVTRKNYSKECPNVGKLLSNLQLSLDMQNEIMGGIIDDRKKPTEAAKEWLTANPEVLTSWLTSVTTVDGQPGLAAVKKHLGIVSKVN